MERVRIDNHGRSAVSISGFANGAVGEQRCHNTARAIAADYFDRAGHVGGSPLVAQQQQQIQPPEGAG